MIIVLVIGYFTFHFIRSILLKQINTKQNNILDCINHEKASQINYQIDYRNILDEEINI